jgi:hypothetical protein
VVSPTKTTSPSTPNLLPICAETLGLLRRLTVLAYSKNPRNDLMRLGLAATLGERSARAGSPPSFKPVRTALADIPFYVGGLSEVRQAANMVHTACPK